MMNHLQLLINNLQLNNETVVTLDRRFIAGRPSLITGKSGKGKTTILKIIAGYYRPKKSKVTINGETRKRKQVAMVFQDFKLIDYESALFNILLPHKISRANEKDYKNKINSLAQDLGIDFSLKRQIKKLSGGQQQKVAILRALSQDFDVFLGDEITSNLDDDYANFILNYIVTNYSDKILIFVSHDRIFEKYCKDFIELS